MSNDELAPREKDRFTWEKVEEEQWNVLLEENTALHREGVFQGEPCNDQTEKSCSVSLVTFSLEMFKWLEFQNIQ